jgi:hypothetical protein
MFATGLAKQIECLRQVLAGFTQTLTHEISRFELY